MKKIRYVICSFILASCLVSCYDDYVGGYIVTNPVDTAQIRETEVICSGKVKIITGKDIMTKITGTGFLYSKDKSIFNDSIVSTQNANSFSCHLTGLSSNTQYYVQAYAIITYEYAKDGVYKDIIYGNISEFTTKLFDDNKDLPYPRNLTAQQVVSSVVLNWNGPPGYNLIWYIVERSNTESGIYTPLENDYGYTENYTNTFTDKSPLNGINYYRVKTVTGYPLEESEYAYILCDFVLPDSDTTVLLSPTGISAVINEEAIKISWTKVSNATDYRIYRCNEANGNYGTPIARIGNVDNWTDNEPLNGDNYYRVSAFNMYESNLSDYAYCKFPESKLKK